MNFLIFFFSLKVSSQRAWVSCVLMWAALYTYTGNSTFQEKINIGFYTKEYKEFLLLLGGAPTEVRLSVPAGAHLAGGKSLTPKNCSNHVHRPLTLNHTDANSAELLPLPIHPPKQ